MMRISIVAAVGLVLGVQAATISRDARCGLDGLGATCLDSQWGSCCSKYGWCGSTDAYCGDGCQGAFSTCKGAISSSRSASSTSIATLIPSSTSVRVSSTSTRSPTPSSTQTVSKNSRCGASFGGQTCLGSKYGDCCSQYFYCGSTDDHCRPSSCQAGYGRCNPVSSSQSSSRSSIRLSTSSTRSSTPSVTLSGTLSTSQPSSSVVSSLSSSQSLSMSSTMSTPTPTLSSSTLYSIISSSVIVSSSDIISSSTPTPTLSSSALSSIISSSDIVSSSATPTPTPTPTPSSSSSSSSTPTPQFTPILKNPGFEEATTSPWIIYPAEGAITTVVDTGDARYGAKTVKMTRVTQLYGSVRQQLTLGPGTYVFTFDVKVEGPIGRCEISVDGFRTQFYGFNTDEAWHTYTGTFTLTAPKTSVFRPVSACDNQPQTGFVYFDNNTLLQVA